MFKLVEILFSIELFDIEIKLVLWYLIIINVVVCWFNLSFGRFCKYIRIFVFFGLYLKLLKLIDIFLEGVLNLDVVFLSIFLSLKWLLYLLGGRSRERL